MAEGRGGPQKIPRPEQWDSGSPAPWIDRNQKVISLETIERAISSYSPPTPTGEIVSGRRSAVLVPIYAHPDGELHIILTRRSAMMKHHTHEVSFPGGNQEPGDADLWATAVREAQEEIGLDPVLPRQIGTLDNYVTVGSNSFITPFVGILDVIPKLQANPIEVEEIIRVPLRELLDPTIYREEIWELQDGSRRPVFFFELIGNTVWGATASMLRQFLIIVLTIENQNFS